MILLNRTSKKINTRLNLVYVIYSHETNAFYCECIILQLWHVFFSWPDLSLCLLFLMVPSYTPPAPTRSKSYPSNRKTHSGNYKSTCCQYNTSIYLIKFKKRSFWPSNFGALALVPRSQKKNSRYVKTVLHPFKLICYHETNV